MKTKEDSERYPIKTSWKPQPTISCLLLSVEQNSNLFTVHDTYINLYFRYITDEITYLH